MKTIELTDAQFDKLEEASDVLSMSHNYCDSLADAVEMVSDFFIRSVGPLYESEIISEETDGLSI